MGPAGKPFGRGRVGVLGFLEPPAGSGGLGEAWRGAGSLGGHRPFCFVGGTESGCGLRYSSVRSIPHTPHLILACAWLPCPRALQSFLPVGHILALHCARRGSCPPGDFPVVLGMGFLTNGLQSPGNASPSSVTAHTRPTCTWSDQKAPRSLPYPADAILVSARLLADVIKS